MPALALNDALIRRSPPASQVQLPGGDEFAKPLASRIMYCVSENAQVQQLGDDVYSRGAGPGEVHVWRRPQVLTRAEERLLKNRYPSKIIVRLNGVYTFVTTEESVEVDGQRLAPGDRLYCTEINATLNRFRMLCIDIETQPAVWLEPIHLTRAGWVSEPGAVQPREWRVVVFDVRRRESNLESQTWALLGALAKRAVRSRVAGVAIQVRQHGHLVRAAGEGVRRDVPPHGEAARQRQPGLHDGVAPDGEPVGGDAADRRHRHVGRPRVGPSGEGAQSNPGPGWAIQLTVRRRGAQDLRKKAKVYPKSLLFMAMIGRRVDPELWPHGPPISPMGALAASRLCPGPLRPTSPS